MRCVITGLGMINSIGNSVDESWNNCINGVSGIKEVKSIDTTECYAHLGAEAAEHFDGGGLARAVHTQQGEQLPLPHGQVQAVHCRYLFILLRQIDDLDRVHFLSPSVSFGKNLSRSP